MKKSVWENISLRGILFSLITLLGIVYLSLVLSDQIKKDRLGQTEVIIFATILLLNSELIERFAKLQFGKDGMTVELEEVKKKQDGQQAEIESIVAFLVTRAMKPEDYQVLQKMANDHPFAMETTRQSGLACLCELGLVEKASGESLNRGDIEKLPCPTDNIKSHIRVSERGRQCLLLVGKYNVNSLEQPPKC